MTLVRTLAGLALFFSGSMLAVGQEHVAPLVHGCLHRDQDAVRPLLNALDLGFCCVELDVHLVKDKLLVGHDKKSLKADRTLETLYLDPLLRRSKANNGRVYLRGPTFTLLIDVKTEGRETYAALRTVLAKYSDMLTATQQGVSTEKAVTVVLSGNGAQAWNDLRADSPQYAGIDGRLSNLASDQPTSILPLISDRWKAHFKWTGVGPMPEDEKAKLLNIVQKVHRRGRRLRFWATPDEPAFWKELRAAGVDLINTDTPQKLRDFLIETEKVPFGTSR